MAVKPITPAEAEKKTVTRIPDFVIEAVNDLIAEKYTANSGSVTLMQKDVIKAIMARGDVTRDTIFSNHWLDFEPVFIKAGWRVSYDKPGYNESYEPSFEFSTKR